jgi:hypothetical protein
LSPNILVASLFYKRRLTEDFSLVIIIGFALKSGDFCPAEASQVVCGVDDGTKTDWLVVRDKRSAFAGASWDYI